MVVCWRAGCVPTGSAYTVFALVLRMWCCEGDCVCLVATTSDGENKQAAVQNILFFLGTLTM